MRESSLEKKGSLTIVGSGIMSLAHLTTEAQAWIRQAEIVLYCVSDPATEIWIKRNNPHSEDLYALYGEDRKRIDTYGDMVSRLLGPVREGKVVCGVFYGHPGLFVMPSHKAIEVARAEGYSARMLPGVSAADCLYSDVGFNPAQAGCQFYEATDLLLHRRVLHPENNVIIWQVGCVGDLASRQGGYQSNLPVLVEYLEQFYDPGCEVVHYQGSVFPGCDFLGRADDSRQVGECQGYRHVDSLHRATEEGGGRQGNGHPPRVDPDGAGSRENPPRSPSPRLGPFSWLPGDAEPKCACRFHPRHG